MPLGLRLDAEAPSRQTGAVQHASPLAGRAEELAALQRGLTEALAGRGQLWLVSGEGGIGKTRLVEEVLANARERASVLFGAAWEAGGAPAYWPWVQVLRQLVRDVNDDDLAGWLGPRASWLLQMLPELAARLGAAAPPALDPEQARFQLMDSVGSLLKEAARERPVVLVLEDLHAADPSSVLLLDFLARELRTSALLVVGTYREAEARQGPVFPLLVRLERHAQKLVLRRLTPEQMNEVLAAISGAEPAPATLALVQRASEGNPLFLGEMARWLAQGGDPRAVPEGIRGPLRARLEHLPSHTRECLAVASVIGRDFTLAELALLADVEPIELADALRPAQGSGLINATEPLSYRFSHYCVREVLHEELSEARRWSLHQKLADALAERARHGGAPLHAEVAHHLLEAGPTARGRALDACERSAEHALQQLAFDDAAVAYERALGSAAQDVPAPRRAALFMGLGQAHTFAGDVRLGRRAFEQALALARDCRDRQLFARAALALGSELVFAEVDAHLVGVLGEALEALGAEPSALRAQVMARLSAAMQPALDPAVPIAMAHEAIAMARAAGDERALLGTLRNACSALMDLADPLERAPLNAEMGRLAERLGSPLDALRAAQRSAFDHVELGARDDVLAAVDRCEALAAALTHPVYGARVQSLRAMLAMHEGRFGQAEGHIEQARRLAEKTDDRNVRRASAVQRFILARLRGDSAAMLASLGDFEAEGLPRFIQTMADVLASEALAGSDLPAARARFDAIDAAHLFALNDPSLIEPLLHASEALADVRFVERICAALSPRAERFVSWGGMGMVWGPPVRYLLGVAERLRGNIEAALELLARAEQSALSVRALPHAAWCAYERARALEGAGRRTEAAAARADAVQRATALGLTGLARRASGAVQGESAHAGSRPAAATAISAAAVRSSSERTAPLAAAPLPATSPGRAAPSEGAAAAACSMACEGETWLLRHAGRQLRLKETKGVRLLARLLEQPGRELHVLDLSDAREAPVGAGLELIDAEARAAYTRRAAQLREELAEAESWNDAGRSARLRAELEQIGSELSRAVGLGGRQRKASDAAERARVNVQRRLRDAIERIREHDSAIGKHLERSIRTGTFCSYDPG